MEVPTKADRKRKVQGNSRTTVNDMNSFYKDISFSARPSSGRPGSPHRYFNDSYDVIFGSGNDAGGAALTSDGKAESKAGATKDLPSNVDTKSSNEPTSEPSANGHQVIHRHLNGLCIITAGNILQALIQDEPNGNPNKVAVSSVKYHVEVAQDSKSARGKVRARTKKVKRDNEAKGAVAEKTDEQSIVTAEGAGSNSCELRHDGNVKPHDKLCTVRLSNGNQVLFKCCVSGTVIEWNQWLSLVASDDDGHNVSSNDECAVPGPKGPNLLLTDPYLDGYLAVILPRGRFPPKS